MVALQLWKDFTVNEVVWYGTKEEWDLIGLGEGEGRDTYTFGVNCSSHSNISLR